MPDASTPARTRRHRVVLGLKLGVSAALLVLLFSKTDVNRLGAQVRLASAPGLVAALLAYFTMILASAWRWDALLGAQRVAMPYVALVHSYLVATFFNNFLPSNIGGDIMRVRDTASPAGSKTLATLIILVDRSIGLVGLLLVAAIAASSTRFRAEERALVWPPTLWAAFLLATVTIGAVVRAPGATVRLLHPFRRIHAEWVQTRLARLANGLSRFRDAPGALVACFAGAVLVQLILIAFYLLVARSLGIGIPIRHLAVIVPVSFVVQMLPVSFNGLGVREAVFSYYFVALDRSIESALVLSLLGSALILLFSLSGAVAYVTRR